MVEQARSRGRQKSVVFFAEVGRRRNDFVRDAHVSEEESRLRRDSGDEMARATAKHRGRILLDAGHGRRNFCSFQIRRKIAVPQQQYCHYLYVRRRRAEPDEYQLGQRYDSPETRRESFFYTFSEFFNF